MCCSIRRRSRLRELEELAKTAGVEVVGYLVQNRKSPDAATYIGDGKLEELKNAADELDADTIIFDDELARAGAQYIRPFGA